MGVDWSLMNQPRKIITCNILTVGCALTAMRFINDSIRRKTLSLFIVTCAVWKGPGYLAKEFSEVAISCSFSARDNKAIYY
ncbi:hypothetical protein ACQJ2W_021415, partial [Pantoea agglomerans]|uniref:hypothetical protein n=1 Tax=Enterobacter agglomerans TaxID=549 RepID=UPI003EE8EFA9